MPLVRISLQSGKPASYRTAISNQVYEGTGETLEIPEGDRFQMITEHDDGTAAADPKFHGDEKFRRFPTNSDVPLPWSDDRK